MCAYSIIELIEYKTASLPQEAITQSVSNILITKFKNQLQVEPPWAMTENLWRITSLGWVGFIPINTDLGISIIPKVPIKNLFGMLTYAYHLKGILFLEGEFKADTLQDFYNYLAEKLSRFVLNRHRKGLYREYFTQNGMLPYVRGRINIHQLIKESWKPYFEVIYQEHSSNNRFNQIIAYTLDIIARSGFCSNRIIPSIRNAHRTIIKYANVIPFTSNDSLSFIYNRLNKDYRPLHILCRFFIEHIGPIVKIGDHTMLPFIIDMSKLFELFVSEWLKVNLPPHYELVTQERFYIGTEEGVCFIADLVIRESNSGEVKFVLDTKYKLNETPSASDLSQVIAYAQSKKSKNAILIYPVKLLTPFAGYSDDIYVRCLSFDLTIDIEKAGQEFLADLLSVFG